MRIRAYKYSLALKQPLRIHSSVLEKRSGILVRMDREGRSGWGDIAPLDGYSEETLGEVEGNIVSILSAAAAGDIGFNHPWASAAAGLYFADQDLRSDADTHSLEVATAALIRTDDSAAALAEAEHAAAQGYRCLKIKVGRRSVREDIDLIQAVQKRLSAKISLRLDANLAWSLKDAVLFASSVDPVNIEFLEEPLATDDYEVFDDASPLPFAFDESLCKRKAAGVENLKKLRALVIKPSLLGSRKAMTWMDFAAERDIDCVISAMYESGVGMRSLMRMAAERTHSSAVSGLDTYSALADDVIDPPIGCAKGKMICSPHAQTRILTDKMELMYDSD